MPNHDDINSINTCHRSRSLLAGSQSSPDYLYVNSQSATPFSPFLLPSQDMHYFLRISLLSLSFLFPKFPSQSSQGDCSARRRPTPWTTSLPSLFLWPSRATQVLLQLRKFPPQPGAVDSVPALPVHTVLCTQVVPERGFCDPAPLGNAEQS